jgi:hypothetical protein
MKFKNYLTEAINYRQEAENLLAEYGEDGAYDFILNQMVMNRGGDGWIDWHKIGLAFDKLTR